MSLDYKCPNCGRQLGYDGLCYRCRKDKERQEIAAWTQEEIGEKLEHLIQNAELLDNWRTPEYEDANHLIDVHGVFSEELQRAAVEVKAYSLPKLYYHAPADVRDELIDHLLQTEDSMEANRLLECLAMQGDEKTFEVFKNLDQHPKEWRKKLYVDASVYAQCGGWTFDKDGTRQELNYKTCYPLVKGTAEDKKKSPVQIGIPREDTCPHCGGKLVDILKVDGTHEKLRFLGVDGMITATCCPNCVPYVEAGFSRFTLEGKSEFIDSAEYGDDMESYVGITELQELSENPFVLGENPVPVFYETEEDAVQTIGGFASWVQDWDYVKCPDCGKPMHLLGQLHWGVLLDDEGTLYIEICPECHTAAVRHQQT